MGNASPHSPLFAEQLGEPTVHDEVDFLEVEMIVPFGGLDAIGGHKGEGEVVFHGECLPNEPASVRIDFLVVLEPLCHGALPSGFAAPAASPARAGQENDPVRMAMNNTTPGHEIIAGLANAFFIAFLPFPLQWHSIQACNQDSGECK